MFDLFFSFRGRIGRLRYFLTSIGSCVIIVATGALAIASIAWKQSPIFSLLVAGVVVLLLVIGSLWSSLSLQARRIRDIGLDPVLVIPAHLVVTIVLGAATTRAGHPVSLIATCVSLAYSGALLFWPGRKDRTPDIEAIFGGGPAGREEAAFAAPMARTLPPAPPRPGRPTKTFGRRGIA